LEQEPGSLPALEPQQQVPELAQGPVRQARSRMLAARLAALVAKRRNRSQELAW
jgi:hypothetical protein